MKSRAIATLLFALVIVGWQFGSGFVLPSYVLPTPSQIAQALVSSNISWPTQTLVTLSEVLIGFILAASFGIAVAVLMGTWRTLREVLNPYIVILQIVPKIALAPILIIAVGYGTAPKIIIAFFIAFFPIVINTLAGLLSAPREIVDVVRSLKGTPIQVFTKVTLPSALPYIFAGLEIAATLSVIGAVVGEFTGSGAGLGYILLLSSTYANAPSAFAALLLLSIMGIGFFYAIVAIERRVMPWHIKSRLDSGGTS